MISHICPFCNKYADTDYVTQTMWRKRKKVQYFHEECLNEYARRNYNERLRKQSHCNNN